VKGGPGCIVEASKKKLLTCLRKIITLPPPGENELPLGYNIVFIDYPEERVKLLTNTAERMHHDALVNAMKADETEEKRLKQNERKRLSRAKKSN
jgi:hypothetical protein